MENKKELILNQFTGTSEYHKFAMINFNKHFQQIKAGGVKVIIKKIRSLFYLLLTFPIYIFAFPTVIILRLIKPFFLSFIKASYPSCRFLSLGSGQYNFIKSI